jgi:glycosyltransferase involved in cell wall biosynthesis
VHDIVSAESSAVMYLTDPDHHSYPLFREPTDLWVLRATDDLSLEVSVSVVIPARNEALNLPYILPQIPKGISEVILVDGKSTDDTVIVAKEIRPDITIVHQQGTGKGDALRVGFERARGDIIVMLDADGSMSPREIPRYIEALVNGADLVTGSRMMHGGGSSDLTALRKLGNNALMTTFSLLYGERCSDLCYGYMAFWRHLLPSLDLDCDGFEIETLMNVRAVVAGLNVAEVPSHEARRLHGNSSLRTFRDGSRVLRTLVTERVRARRLRRDELRLAV